MRKTDQKQNSLRWFIVAAVGLVVLGGVWFGLRRSSPASDPASDIADKSPTTERISESTAEQAAHSSDPALPSPDNLLSREWDGLTAGAQAAAEGGPEAIRHFVYGLFAELDRLSPADRLAVVLAFFESGRDVSFGGRMSFARGGQLQEWPSLRTALFDYLSQRDGSAARDLARILLQTRPEEPGEWTLALRELVRGKLASEWSAFVRERVHAFVGDEAWQQESRHSWLEGFDVVVAGRDPTAFLPDLSAVASSGSSRGAQFAAFLASDRLMLAEPAKTLATLNENPALYAREPNVRAGLFARADVRRSDQLRQLESYLRRPDVSATEREAFAGLFPHYDLAVSFNLLTPPSSRQMADMIAHDRAALRQIEAWLSDPDFADWHSGLRTVQDRLREQLGEADRG